jgi:hypothetical protein
MRLLRLVESSLLAMALLVCSPLHIHAQNSIVTPATAPSWQRIEQLPVHTAVNVSKDNGKLSCSITAVTDDQLTCSTKGSNAVQISRAEIKSIKLSNRGRSAVVGLLLGAGIGAGAGVGIGLMINSGDKGSWVHVSSGKAAGVGAALGFIIGAIPGTLIGYSTDHFGTTVYKR